MTDFSPTDEHPTGSWRTRFLVVAVCGMWLVLAGRMIQLQWLSRHRFAEQVENQSTFLEEIPARPGDIFDREGRVLATTVAAKSFFLVPSQIAHQPQPFDIVRRVAEAVGQDADQLHERISTRPDLHFLWVRRRIIDAEVIDKLAALKLPFELGGFRDEFLRQYPQGHLAAHVIGGRDIDGVGRGGIEETLNDQLAGRNGHRRLVLDSRRRVVEVQTDISEAPRHGQSVSLTIDTVIQLHVEHELDAVMTKWRAKHAAAIVLDPKTGEVLAMGSRPTYDPNDLTHVDPEAWKNQALAAIYEPGSTFKPFIVCWGIQNGFIKSNDSFHCENGEYRMRGGRLLHDHHKYGLLSLTDVMVKSSNIGMAKIGEKMGNAELYRATVLFGFGRKTGIELPGELSGMLHPLRKWTSYSTGSIPMGQELAVTPLQLIAAHGALANRGTFITPRVVRSETTRLKGRPWAERPELDERAAETPNWLRPISHTVALRDESDNADSREDRETDGEPMSDSGLPTSAVVSETVTPEIARWMVEDVMTEVVKRGTGRKARLPEYTVFGKTGTAQKRDPATGLYSNELHVSSFVGGAPASNPKVVVLVMVDEPSTSGEHFGGDIAAPPAREIMQKALIQLGVPPEQKPDKTANAADDPLNFD